MLLAAEGHLPRLDVAIFTDTGWEPRAVYEHLDRLEREVAEPAGIPILRVASGNIRDDALDPTKRFASMPLHILNPGGGEGMSRRQCTVICTLLLSLVIATLSAIDEEKPVELQHELIEGRAELPRVGAVVPAEGAHPPHIVVNGYGEEIEVATAYLRDLALNDCSPLTVRSYDYGLLRWFRLLWLLGVAWGKATESEVAVLAGWLRMASNPQRQRKQPGGAAPGSVNLKTGKPALRAGYAPRTINHALSVVSGFYGFHAHQGNGPVVNPVPVNPQRRRALSHRSPLEPRPAVGRARLRRPAAAFHPRPALGRAVRSHGM
ncbi:hypothetical protein ACFV4F_35960 [Kitasatospora sp. NPDC059722]|uniref:hypothetical protein n=1 Tax=Kitasatospora sp. NPDC059722 TaxID=3346925 RepID=UPI00367579B7